MLLFLVVVKIQNFGRNGLILVHGLCLQEKLDRLYALDRDMQEQSFQVTSLKEDRVGVQCFSTLSIKMLVTSAEAEVPLSYHIFAVIVLRS